MDSSNSISEITSGYAIFKELKRTLRRYFPLEKERRFSLLGIPS
jgi:hypothetical protein